MDPTSKKTYDMKEFKKRLLLAYAASPWVLAPFVTGATILLATWTFSLRMGLLTLGGVAGILGAIGCGLTWLILGHERVGRKVVEEMQQEIEGEREKALDDLDRRLVEDGDVRTEHLLRDLRALTKGFREGLSQSASLNASSAFDILSGVEELFGQCVLSLERTLRLWHTAKQMASRDAAKALLAQRERIVEDVGESIRQLSGILAGIQGSSTLGDASDSELARIREELDQNLQVARKVEERMRLLDREIEDRPKVEG